MITIRKQFKSVSDISQSVSGDKTKRLYTLRFMDHAAVLELTANSRDEFEHLLSQIAWIGTNLLAADD